MVTGGSQFWWNSFRVPIHRVLQARPFSQGDADLCLFAESVLAEQIKGVWSSSTRCTPFILEFCAFPSRVLQFWSHMQAGQTPTQAGAEELRAAQGIVGALGNGPGELESSAAPECSWVARLWPLSPKTPEGSLLYLCTCMLYLWHQAVL